MTTTPTPEEKNPREFLLKAIPALEEDIEASKDVKEIRLLKSTLVAFRSELAEMDKEHPPTPDKLFCACGDELLEPEEIKENMCENCKVPLLMKADKLAEARKLLQDWENVLTIKQEACCGCGAPEIDFVKQLLEAQNLLSRAEQKEKDICIARDLEAPEKKNDGYKIPFYDATAEIVQKLLNS